MNDEKVCGLYLLCPRLITAVRAEDSQFVIVSSADGAEDLLFGVAVRSEYQRVGMIKFCPFCGQHPGQYGRQP